MISNSHTEVRYEYDRFIDGVWERSRIPDKNEACVPMTLAEYASDGIKARVVRVTITTQRTEEILP